MIHNRGMSLWGHASRPAPGGSVVGREERGHRASRSAFTRQWVLFHLFRHSKKGGGLRPILDLRPLNKHLKVLKFCMLHTTDVLQGIRKHDWFTAIDLEDAYFHVPIAPHHRQFLRFAFEGRAYQFRVLPFGMSLAPRVFTWFVAAALSPLQGRGMRIFPYLDDWLVCARSRVDALSDLALLIEHVTRLGLTVNYAKSSLTPS